jgi:alkylation response protein AidB-like acyl-CoA dehydrogenase
MRATGSHDVLIDGHVVPDAAIAVKRKAAEWHMVFQVTAMIAIPIIYSVYVGVAEAARDIALELARKRRPDPHTTELIGRMDTELRGAQLAHASMLAAARANKPGPETTNEVMIGRTLTARHAIAAVELAMETAGGAGFYRAAGLERRFRDIQGARYHPMQSGTQATFAGTLALGLPTDRVF